MAADLLVMGDVEIMEFGAVVIADQPRRLLEMGRVEVHPRGRRIAEGLLAARDQRLGEQAADRLAAEQAQDGRAAPARLKIVLGLGRAQPLEVDRQLRAVEVVALASAAMARGRSRFARVGMPRPSSV